MPDCEFTCKKQAIRIIHLAPPGSYMNYALSCLQSWRILFITIVVYYYWCCHFYLRRQRHHWYYIKFHGRRYAYYLSAIAVLLYLFPENIELIHWGRVTHIYVRTLTIISSYNGLPPGRCQDIIWTNAGTVLIRSLGTKFSEILIEIYIFLLKKMHLKISSGNWWPSCPGLNVLKAKHWNHTNRKMETANTFTVLQTTVLFLGTHFTW